MTKRRRSYEAGHSPKFLVVIDDTPECDRAVYFASRRALRTGAGSGPGRFSTLEPSRAEAHRRHVEALISDVDLSNVGALSDDKLTQALATYLDEEGSVSQRRRQVQVVVDLLNDEIANRYRRRAASVDDLLNAQRGRAPRAE